MHITFIMLRLALIIIIIIIRNKNKILLLLIEMNKNKLFKIKGETTTRIYIKKDVFVVMSDFHVFKIIIKINNRTALL